MPERSDEASPLRAAVRTVDPRFRGSDRHALGVIQYVMKAPRRRDGTDLVEEWVNELVSNEVAREIGIPVAETKIDALDDGHVWLFSAVYSTVGLDQIPSEMRASISNIGQLPGLLVLDQLIFNTDRREDHVMLTGDPRKGERSEWYAIDHGHAFNGPDGGGADAETSKKMAGSLAPIRIDYRVRNAADVEPYLSRVEEMTDERIDQILADILRRLLRYSLPPDVRARLEFRAVVVAELLKFRRNRIRILLGEFIERLAQRAPA